MVLNSLSGGESMMFLYGQGRTEGTAVVPPKKKTLCALGWARYME